MNDPSSPSIADESSRYLLASGPDVAGREALPPAPDADGYLLPWAPSLLDDPVAEPAGDTMDRPRGEAIHKRVEEFNHDARHALAARQRQIVSSKREILAEEDESRLPPLAGQALEHYALADCLAIAYGRKTQKTFRHLFVGAMVAMCIFEMTAHWLFGHEWTTYRIAALAIYPVVWLAVFYLWRRAESREFQSKYLDYRALAEGLRVQFFWRLLGLPDAVEDHYLDKQRDELQWIRYALRFWRLSDETRLGPQGDREEEFARHGDLVRRLWVDNQRHYFEHCAGPREKSKGDKCRGHGQSLFQFSLVAAVGLVLAIALPLAFSVVPDPSETLIDALLVLVALTIVASALRIGYGEKMAFLQHANRYDAIAKRFHDAQKQLSRKDLRGEEVASIYRDLGREALAENGDWLLIHRERPLEIPVP